MPRHRRGIAAGVAAAVTAAGTLALGGCQTEAPSGGCELAQQVSLPGSDLTLLSEARLDRIGDGFVLIGADAEALRWATLDGASGTLGPERAAPLPPARAGLWYALAGGQAPGDTVLAAVGTAAANGSDEELQILTVPADASAPPTPGPVAIFPAGTLFPGDPAGAPALVAMGSSRQGMAAGLAWINGPAGTLVLTVFSGSGNPVLPAAPVEAAPPGGAFGCVAFQPGKSALTLTYYRYSDGTGAGTPAPPTLVIAEVAESGVVEPLLGLPLPNASAGCPLVAPTAAGYAFTWQDPIGTWLSVFDAGTNRITTYPVAAAVGFGGADLQPPLGGFGPVGGVGGYGVVFAKVNAAELWRLSVIGGHGRGTLGFPSVRGDLGTLSSQPVAGSLYTTYADYTAIDGGVGAAGQRYFLRVTCF